MFNKAFLLSLFTLFSLSHQNAWADPYWQDAIAVPNTNNIDPNSVKIVLNASKNGMLFWVNNPQSSAPSISYLVITNGSLSSVQGTLDLPLTGPLLWTDISAEIDARGNIALGYVYTKEGSLFYYNLGYFSANSGMKSVKALDPIPLIPILTQATPSPLLNTDFYKISIAMTEPQPGGEGSAVAAWTDLSNNLGMSINLNQGVWDTDTQGKLSPVPFSTVSANLFAPNQALSNGSNQTLLFWPVSEDLTSQPPATYGVNTGTQNAPHTVMGGILPPYLGGNTFKASLNSTFGLCAGILKEVIIDPADTSTYLVANTTADFASWATPNAVYLPQNGNLLRGIELSMNANSDAIALFLEKGSSNSVKALSFTGAGDQNPASWDSSPQTLFSNPNPGSDPSADTNLGQTSNYAVALDNLGNAVAICSDENNAIQYTFSAKNPGAPRSWSTPVSIDASASNNGKKSFALNENGIGVLAWSKKDPVSADTSLYYSVMDVGSGPLPLKPADISTQLIKNRYVFQTEYIQELSWKGIPDPTIELYKVYSDPSLTNLIAQIQSNSEKDFYSYSSNNALEVNYTLEKNGDNTTSPYITLRCHNTPIDGKQTSYYITTCTSDQESLPVQVTIPNGAKR